MSKDYLIVYSYYVADHFREVTEIEESLKVTKRLKELKEEGYDIQGVYKADNYLDFYNR